MMLIGARISIGRSGEYGTGHRKSLDGCKLENRLMAGGGTISASLSLFIVASEDP